MHPRKRLHLTGGGFLPLDGGMDVDPEHAGEDRGGELEGEGKQGCGAHP
jgi:hypothetical protein